MTDEEKAKTRELEKFWEEERQRVFEAEREARIAAGIDSNGRPIYDGS